MKRIILGTAGHVDHGKTTLVRCMTGVNTDRLKEEISRGITIELGFAPFVLPNGQRIGIVDVPGHEKFIKNMLAGTTGIDIVLFVIAADEGIMPQTREHMDILRLLGVECGVVVLTKTDMADDEWLALVREDVEEYLKDSPLSGAPIIEVSSVTGKGIDELIAAISDLCLQVPERPARGAARLAVDRAFIKPGFGTVVTGTLWSGSIKLGDTLELLPACRQVRVRSLQVHGDKRDEVYAGERVAINLPGVEKELAERGSWLASPGTLRESSRIDIRLQMLPDAPELANRTRIHVHHGTAEVLARLVLLDRSSVAPGESCFAQLELESPLASLAGDRMIFRFYSPMYTIGGGIVVDPAASKHRRRSMDSELSRLSALHSGEPRQILSACMKKDGQPWQVQRIASCLMTDEEAALALASEMADSGMLVALPDGFFMDGEKARELAEKLEGWMKDYFDRYPLRFGVPKKEIAQVHFPHTEQKQQRALFQYLEASGVFEQDETSLSLAGRRPQINAEQEKLIGQIRGMYAETPFSPPRWSEAAAALNIPDKQQGEFLQWFLRSGEMVRLSDDGVYTRDALKKAEELLRAGSAQGSFSLAEARDILGCPRKYAQQIVEYFDLTKVTQWDGERHFWK